MGKRKLKWPEEMKILSYYWDLDFDKKHCEVEDAAGMTYFEDHKVVIDPEVDIPQTIIHELIHVFFWQLGIEQPSEKNVENAAQLISAFISDNPILIANILSSLCRDQLEIHKKRTKNPI